MTVHSSFPALAAWGTSWGEAGFVYVQYGHNVCGLTAQAAITTPMTVAKLNAA